MSELTDLYQEVILDHNRSPRNFRTIEGADRVTVGHNPVCGDRLSLFVKLDGDRIADVAFQGSGCAISKASASRMTESVRGKSLGKLAVFSGVREFPVRVKCATLSWHTLKAALHEEVAATTE